MKHSVSLAGLLVVAAATFSGCARQPDAGTVPRQVADNTAALGLRAVYPIRENLQVGDILLVASAESRKDLPDYVDAGRYNLYRMDLKAALETHYQLKYNLPKATYSAPAAGAAWPQPVVQSGSVFDRVSPPPRLTMAQIPAFRFASVRGSELAAAAPLGVVALGLGLGLKDDRQVTLQYDGIEEMDLPIGVMRVEAEKFCSALSMQVRSALADQTKQIVSAPLPDHPKGQKIQWLVLFVSNVLYARSIDMAFGHDMQFRGDIKANISELQKLAALVQGGLGTGLGVPAVPQPGAAPASQPAPGNLGPVVASLASQNTPGIAGSFVAMDSERIVIKSVYERPMAFAASGIAFNADQFWMPGGRGCNFGVGVVPDVIPPMMIK